MATEAFRYATEQDQNSVEEVQLHQAIEAPMCELEQAIAGVANELASRFQEALRCAQREREFGARLAQSFGVDAAERGRGGTNPSTGVQGTVGEMMSAVDRIAHRLSSAAEHLHVAEQVLMRALRLNAEMRRTGRISRFLATQATVESRRSSSELRSAFGANADSVRQLADSSSSVCESIEYHISGMRSTIETLSIRVVRQQAAIREYKTQLSGVESFVAASRAEYEGMMQERLVKFNDSNEVVLRCLQDIMRGLQFEDIALQLVGQIRLSARGEGKVGHERVVVQESMSAGAVELF